MSADWKNGVYKIGAMVPMTAEMMLDVPAWAWKDEGKFHLDDDAKLHGGWVAMPLFVDPDHVQRPWRYAHRNPMPNFVLFPRLEPAIAKAKARRDEAQRRWSNIKAAAAGDDFGGEW